MRISFDERVNKMSFRRMTYRVSFSCCTERKCARPAAGDVLNDSPGGFQVDITICRKRSHHRDYNSVIFLFDH